MDVFKAMDLPRRFFRHGDIREDGLVFCVRCDLFHDWEHEHWLLVDESLNLELYYKAKRRLNRKHFYRPRNAYNLLFTD